MVKSRLRNLAETIAYRFGAGFTMCGRAFLYYKQLALFFIFPLIWSPLLIFDGTPAARCGYIVLVMGCFWAFDVIPMPMTALIPVVFYPLLRIAESSAICQHYMTANNMLFLGGLMISLAIEETRLHERVALRTLMVFGTSPRWLMAGLMSVAAVLSMWISNTATTAMLLPIAQGVCLELAQKVPLAHRIRSVGSIVRARQLQQQKHGCLPTVHFNSVIEVRPPWPPKLPSSSSSTDLESKNSMSLTPLLGDAVFSIIKNDHSFDPRATTTTPERKYPIRQSLPSGGIRRPLQAQLSVGNFIHTTSNDEELELPANTTRLRAVLHTYPQPLQRLFGGLMLCIAYASNIGGTATLIGTPTNLIFKSMLDQQYGTDAAGVNFANFMVFGVPCAMGSLALCWLYMQWVYCAGGFGSLRRKISMLFARMRQRGQQPPQNDRPSSPKSRDFYDVNEVQISDAALRERYAQLGPLSWAEGSTTVLFVVLFMAWIFRHPGFMPGWSDQLGLGTKFVSDTQPAIFVAILLFVWPFHKPRWPLRARTLDGGNKANCDNVKHYRALLNWRTVEANFPWGVVLLLGGGVAMAKGVQTSGLGRVLSVRLAALSTALPPWLVVILISLSVSFVTEFVSNTAATTVAVPILFQLAQSAKQNPVYYSLPAAIASSFAFMLPVATPPNAIVYSCGWLKLTDMLKVGWVVNLLCTVVLVICMHTVAILAFGVLNYPNWAIAVAQNVTVVTVHNATRIV